MHCPPDLGKLTEMMARFHWLDGYEAGNYDMTITASNAEITRVWYIEFKGPGGNLTDGQKDLAARAKGTKIVTVTIRNVDEFDAFLKAELF